MKKLKLYPCEKCGRMVPIRSKGLCPSCRSKEKPIKKSYIKNRPVGGKKESNPGLSGFFSYMLGKLELMKTSLTGKPIHCPTVCNVCHILPKRYYKSVAMNEDNILFLTDEEHTRFDYLLDCMEFEKLETEFRFVWKVALKRIYKMLSEGAVEENGRLLNNIIENYFSNGKDGEYLQETGKSVCTDRAVDRQNEPDGWDLCSEA